MSDEDLGSFFAEINQIEAEVVVAAEPAIGPEIGPAIGPEIGPAMGPQVVVSSKPAMSNRTIVAEQVASSSHPVYTYAQYDINNHPTVQAVNNYDNQQPELQFYRNVSSNDISSSSSMRPPQPPVAPPQVPRQSKTFVRKAAEETWVDDTLQEWPDNDYRIFVGDLAKEITTENLAKAFQHYASYAKAKVIRTKGEDKARGFGFVSFLDPMDCAKAIREQNGKYLGARPMKIRKSTWKDKDIKEVKKKEVKKRKMEESLGLV